MTPVRERALQRVKDTVLQALRNKAARVYLFGSCATGAVPQSSDIDVAIEPLEPLPAGFFSDLRETLEESTIPYEVDVVDLREAGNDLRQRVLAEGITWKT
jgi:hypothetical protein